MIWGVLVLVGAWEGIAEACLKTWCSGILSLSDKVRAVERSEDH